MAVTNISPIKIKDVNTESAEISLKTGTVAEGFEVLFTGKDFKTLILAKGGAAAGKLTVLKGNGIQGVTDVEFSIPAGGYTAFTLDSGLFKNVTGALKGKIKLMPTAADISIAVIELP